jgi:hypothetical protein
MSRDKQLSVRWIGGRKYKRINAYTHSCKMCSLNFGACGCLLIAQSELTLCMEDGISFHYREEEAIANDATKKFLPSGRTLPTVCS